MMQIEYTKRYVVYRVEEQGDTFDEDKIVICGCYTKLDTAKLAAKREGAEILDTHRCSEERLAQFNALTGSEFGDWTESNGMPIRIPELNYLSKLVARIILERFKIPVISLTPLIRCKFADAVSAITAGDETPQGAAERVAGDILKNPERYLYITPR